MRPQLQGSEFPKAVEVPPIEATSVGPLQPGAKCPGGNAQIGAPQVAPRSIPNEIGFGRVGPAANEIGFGRVGPHKGSLPAWLKERFEAGQTFDKANRARYPYNEVEVTVKGETYRVDSLIPARVKSFPVV